LGLALTGLPGLTELAVRRAGVGLLERQLAPDGKSLHLRLSRVVGEGERYSDVLLDILLPGGE